MLVKDPIREVLDVELGTGKSLETLPDTVSL